MAYRRRGSFRKKSSRRRVGRTRQKKTYHVARGGIRL